MNNIIKRYQVKHPLLRKYIKFFWQLSIENTAFNHSIIPQRNINLRFNLNDTPHYAFINDKEYLLEDVYLWGLQDKYMNARIKISGKLDIFGICFFPEGLFPFINIPINEFKNQILGVKEIGIKIMSEICNKLKEINDNEKKLEIIENELLYLLYSHKNNSDNFNLIFKTLNNNCNSLQISEFCKQNNINIRNLERMFNKHIGLTASTFSTLNRFHLSMNQLLQNNYDKFSDLAFDNDYFDQMHFIRDFKRFTGTTPRCFVHQKNSIMQVGKFA